MPILTPRRLADANAFVAGLTELTRRYGIALAATGGITLPPRRSDCAGVRYLAHIESGHLEPCFPGDSLDLVCGPPCADRRRQAEYDAFVAGLTALTRQTGVALFLTRGIYRAGRPGEFGQLTYRGDLLANRLEPRFPDDGKGAISRTRPKGARCRIGERIGYVLPDGQHSGGLVQGWRAGRVVVRHKDGYTEEVLEQDILSRR
jgi:hypothetical protein